MATSQISEVIQYLRRTVLLRDGAGLTDGQLLEDYISGRDEAALAALVRRHGPMVWGVCRRVLRNYHDAEDAFQATFLVLVRKAASIMPRKMVANWLYGVAHQTALKARATAAKKKGRERQVKEMPEPAAVEQDLWSDLQPLLDEELSRLPDKYRAVIVLCDLGGRTRKEAARQLGVPEGTVAGWLARARTMLAKRLTQRGVALSGGVLAAVLSQKVAAAGVPSSVVSSTITAATLFAAGQAAGLISVKVAALTEGVLKSMLLTKLKIATAVLSAVVVLAAGASVVTLPARAVPPPRPVKAEPPGTPAAAPKEKPKGAQEGADAAAKKAHDELAKAYALQDEEVLKCVKPPYLAARQDWWRLVHAPRYNGTLDDAPSNMVLRWHKGELKHWSSTIAFGPNLAELLPTLAPLQPEEIEGDQDLLKTIQDADGDGFKERFGVDFIAREGAPAEKIVASLEKILRAEFALPVKMTFREVERKVYVASGKYRFVPVKGRADDRIEVYGKKLVDPKSGGHGRGNCAEFLRRAGTFIGKRIIAGKIEGLPQGQLQWHENYLAAFTEAEQQEARDPVSVLKHLTEQTGLTFTEETRSVRVLFVERKD